MNRSCPRYGCNFAAGWVFDGDTLGKFKLIIFMLIDRRMPLILGFSPRNLLRATSMKGAGTTANPFNEFN
ncbi:MAG: hypothetical protein ACI9ND_002168 [Yoonia sp.]|jgi:hypothetical protein